MAPHIFLCQWRFDGSGMNGRADGVLSASRQLYRSGFHDLVERGFGGAVGHPTAQVVVPDRADACRQAHEETPFVARQMPHEMLENQSRADSVQGELFGHGTRVKTAQGFFRPLPFNFQRPCCIKNQIERTRKALRKTRD